PVVRGLVADPAVVPALDHRVGRDPFHQLGASSGSGACTKSMDFALTVMALPGAWMVRSVAACRISFPGASSTRLPVLSRRLIRCSASSTVIVCPSALCSDQRLTLPPSTPGSGGSVAPYSEPSTSPPTGPPCGTATSTASPASGSATRPLPLPAPWHTTPSQPASASPCAGSVTLTRPRPSGSSTSVTFPSVIALKPGWLAGAPAGGSVPNAVR